MSAILAPQLTGFALDVAEGLGSSGQKRLSPLYFYDELGSSLFEVITLLPEYGLTRADERLLRTHAKSIVRHADGVDWVAELGSGSGRKTRHILSALASNRPVKYSPIDISPAALELCARQLGDVAAVETICADWLEGLKDLARQNTAHVPVLLLFLGSSIGNLPRNRIVSFLRDIRTCLRPGDLFLLGADLVKDVEVMLTAYDDPTGVTAAFNLNLLGRMNRELGANFELRSFAHEARWNDEQRCIEMHLLSLRNQTVRIPVAGREFVFSAGETIWTESSHKFDLQELKGYARASGFEPLQAWTDAEWPFAEVLWQPS
jgi:L-histidine N-alpha-methyltransferase